MSVSTVTRQEIYAPPLPPLPDTTRKRPPVRQGLANSQRLKALVAVATFFGLAVLLLLGAAQVATLGRELTASRENLAEVTAQNQRLELQVARLKDPRRIAQIAAAQGLKNPGPEDEVQVLALSSRSETEDSALVAMARGIGQVAGETPVMAAAEETPASGTRGLWARIFGADLPQVEAAGAQREIQ